MHADVRLKGTPLSPGIVIGRRHSLNPSRLIRQDFGYGGAGGNLKS